MTRLEPNFLLALSTGFGLLLVVLTATVYGAGEPLVRNLLLAGICAGSFVLLNPLMMRALKQAPRPPMIHPMVNNGLIWAGAFPLAVLICAAIPVFWQGADYGLLIIIAAVFFGVTLESALKARKAS